MADPPRGPASEKGSRERKQARSGNRILYNYCDWLDTRGGGIFVQSDAGRGIKIVGNVLAGNFVSGQEGAAVALGGGTVDFFNNTVVGNGYFVSAAAVYIGPRPRDAFRIYNNIIAGNVGVGIKNDYWNPVPPVLDFNNVWNNGRDYENLAPGPHDVSLDPRFAGLRDHHLTPGSPMIDAGANLPTGEQTGLDLHDDPRFVDGTSTGRVARSDIGADEFNPTRMSLTGAPWPGNTLRFQVEGWPGARFYLFWSPYSAHVLIQPYGRLLGGGARCWPSESRPARSTSRCRQTLRSSVSTSSSRGWSS